MPTTVHARGFNVGIHPERECTQYNEVEVDVKQKRDYNNCNDKSQWHKCRTLFMLGLEDARMTASLEGLSFEETLAELESVVVKLESGALDLDQTVSLYQRGRALASRCQQLLDAVELRIQQLVPDGAGGHELVDFDVGA